jgi:hypothetical protein
MANERYQQKRRIAAVMCILKRLRMGYWQANYRDRELMEWYKNGFNFLHNHLNILTKELYHGGE